MSGRKKESLCGRYKISFGDVREWTSRSDDGDDGLAPAGAPQMEKY